MKHPYKFYPLEIDYGQVYNFATKIILIRNYGYNIIRKILSLVSVMCLERDLLSETPVPG